MLKLSCSAGEYAPVLELFYSHFLFRFFVCCLPTTESRLKWRTSQLFTPTLLRPWSHICCRRTLLPYRCWRNPSICYIPFLFTAVPIPWLTMKTHQQPKARLAVAIIVVDFLVVASPPAHITIYKLMFHLLSFFLLHMSFLTNPHLHEATKKKPKTIKIDLEQISKIK